MPSRWADSAEDAAEDAKRKAEKQEKRRLRAEQEAEAAQREQETKDQDQEPPAKRRRVSETDAVIIEQHVPSNGWSASGSVAQFTHLNRIEEGSYGTVSRVKDKATGEVLALKQLKLDPLRDGGFPVTALREIQCLSIAKHRHIVDLREVVVGRDGTDVYLVMEFLEHDLKSLQEEMQDPFTASEVKTLLLQIGSAVEFLHDHWILHRDLKTSNILMNNRGEIKLADFGMARISSDPPPENLTQLVVTLWYRAPELLLGTKSYDTTIDIWSIGCIFAELLAKQPVLQGKNEVDQISKIFELCGDPDDTWPQWRRLPNARPLKVSHRTKNSFETRFAMSENGMDLLRALMQLDPARRPSAKQLLSHEYFTELPRPKPTAMFPTFPSKAGQEKRRQHTSPPAPKREADFTSTMTS